MSIKYQSLNILNFERLDTNIVQSYKKKMKTFLYLCKLF